MRAEKIKLSWVLQKGTKTFSTLQAKANTLANSVGPDEMAHDEPSPGPSLFAAASVFDF